jgi:hypothetical protein
MIVKKIFKTFTISFKLCGAVVVVIVIFNVVGFISTDNDGVVLKVYGLNCHNLNGLGLWC